MRKWIVMAVLGVVVAPLVGDGRPPSPTPPIPDPCPPPIRPPGGGTLFPTRAHSLLNKTGLRWQHDKTPGDTPGVLVSALRDRSKRCGMRGEILPKRAGRRV